MATIFTIFTNSTTSSFIVLGADGYCWGRFDSREEATAGLAALKAEDGLDGWVLKVSGDTAGVTALVDFLGGAGEE